MNTNRLYFGKIWEVENITAKSIFHPYLDTLTTRHLKPLNSAILYKVDEKNYIDIRTKQKYSADIDTLRIGEKCVNPKKIELLTKILDSINKNNILKENMSRRMLVKTIWG